MQLSPFASVVYSHNFLLLLTAKFSVDLPLVSSLLVQTLTQAEAALRGLKFDYFVDFFFPGKWRLVKDFSFLLLLWFCIFFQDFSCMSLFTPNTVTAMITFNMFRFWQFEHVECLSFVVFSFYTWAYYGRGTCGCIMQCLNVAYCFV